MRKQAVDARGKPRRTDDAGLFRKLDISAISICNDAIAPRNETRIVVGVKNAFGQTERAQDFRTGKFGSFRGWFALRPSEHGAGE